MANSIFKVKPGNLEFARALLSESDVAAIHIHGDGNVYSDKESSDFRKNFSNPGPSGGSVPASKYRVTFKNPALIPETVAEMETLFYEQKNKEDAAEHKEQTTTAAKVKTFSMPKKAVTAAAAGGVKSQAELDEEQLAAEIEAEDKKKAAAAGGATK